MKFRTIVSSNNSIAKKIIIAIIILLILAFAVYAILGYNDKLTVQQYSIATGGKLENPVRIALITDLHSCKYGEGQQELIDAINAQNPDLVAFAGDLFDDDIPDDNTEYLLQGIAKNYPCYYVTGNHEFWSGTESFDVKMSILKKYNVTILSGEAEKAAVNGSFINICGADDPDQGGKHTDNLEPFTAQLEAAKESAPGNYYTVLLSHRPEQLELYAEYGFDLVLSGHAHGGQWRIPGVLNGLFAPDQGLFPQYAGGVYQKSGTTMIVSRGLAKETTFIPRLFNPPELVIVDLI